MPWHLFVGMCLSWHSSWLSLCLVFPKKQSQYWGVGSHVFLYQVTQKCATYSMVIYFLERNIFWVTLKFYFPVSCSKLVWAVKMEVTFLVLRVFLFLSWQMEGFKRWLALSPWKGAMWYEFVCSALRAQKHWAIVNFTWDVCLWLWKPQGLQFVFEFKNRGLFFMLLALCLWFDP